MFTYTTYNLSEFFSLKDKIEYDFKDNKFLIEVPGFNKDNLSVELEDNVLIVKGEKGNKNSFTKYFTIPKGVSLEDPKADVTDGILTITFKPKERIKLL